ncbi:SDR family NAD(P)-dependent oxidoreductase [Zavarzinia sp. CC-PAN008]|uniref:SDR family NAD(P)-dependent oxidoreductase n=1 Tax=Zavarzinia sp. CC-PAN008 TaxID=3243332 RepID=UPI003F747E4A
MGNAMAAGRLAGKVAVITGGASGMGREAALRFIAEGAQVVIVDLNEKTAEETLGLAGQAGGAAAIRFQKADVSDEGQVQAAIDLAVRSFGRLDCVFNNAGVGGAIGPLTELTVEAWDRTFAQLTRSVFLGIKHGARVMIAQGWGGSIINTASVAGMGGGAGPAPYSAAKAAVVNLGCNAAMELAPHRIRVNTIAPGGIYTPLVGVRSQTDMQGFMQGRQPWPDVGMPSDIANAALFLASDESRFMTGSTVLVDGGLLARGPGLFQDPTAISGGRTVFNMGSTGTR